jgi:hypothetical protein
MSGSHERQGIRTRIVEAALAFLERDGSATLDTVALAKVTELPQSRIVQLFSTRESIMQAVLLNVIACLLKVRKLDTAELGAAVDQSGVIGQLAMCREVCLLPQRTLFSLLQFAASDTDILEYASASEKAATACVISQSADPETDLIRLYAGRGLAISYALGLCQLSPAERSALLDRLSDDAQWSNWTLRNTRDS